MNTQIKLDDKEIQDLINKELEQDLTDWDLETDPEMLWYTNELKKHARM